MIREKHLLANVLISLLIIFILGIKVIKSAINNIKKNFPEVYDTKCFNMLDGMPFDNNSFELIIADLCLHYFKEKDTFELLNEIRQGKRRY